MNLSRSLLTVVISAILFVVNNNFAAMDRRARIDYLTEYRSRGGDCLSACPIPYEVRSVSVYHVLLHTTKH